VDSARRAAGERDHARAPHWIPQHGERPFHLILRFQRGPDKRFSCLEIDRRFAKVEIDNLQRRRAVRPDEDLASLAPDALTEIVVRTNVPAPDAIKEQLARFRGASISYVVA
jgi:hypothetical protein